MQPKAKEHLEPPEAGRSRGWSLKASEGSIALPKLFEFGLFSFQNIERIDFCSFMLLNFVIICYSSGRNLMKNLNSKYFKFDKLCSLLDTVQLLNSAL